MTALRVFKFFKNLRDVDWANITAGQLLTRSGDILVSTDAPAVGIANMTLANSSAEVVDETNLQVWADGVDHALFKNAGTGVNTSYVSVAAAGGTTFDQPEIFGEIKSDEGYFDIHYAGATGVTVTDLASSVTYVYIDNAGALQQQTTLPTREDWSRKIFTMKIGVNITTNQIVGFEYINNPIGNAINSLRDIYSYLLAQGVPFKKDLLITGRVADLGFDISAGTLLQVGGTGDIDNPNIRSYDAVANTGYTLVSRTAIVSVETDLVKEWDNAGTVTALGSTTCVAHRVYSSSSGNIVIQYGQGNYANMTLCKAGARLEEFVLNPVLRGATFMGWWLLEETATATAGTADAEFVEYTIGVQGGSSSVLSGCLLKGNNLSDLLHVETARDNLGLGSADDVAFADITANGTLAVGASGAATAAEFSRLKKIIQQTLTDGANISWDADLGHAATVTLAGARTLDDPTNLVVGTLVIKVIQDATGSRTLAYGSAYKWAGGTAPTLTATANAVDLLTFYCDGTNLYGGFLGDLS